MILKRISLITTIVISSMILCSCNRAGDAVSENAINEEANTAAENINPNAIENAFEGGPLDQAAEAAANTQADNTPDEVVAPTEEEQHQRMLNVIRSDDPVISGAVADRDTDNNSSYDSDNNGTHAESSSEYGEDSTDPFSNSIDNPDSQNTPNDGKSKTPMLFDVGDSTLFVVGGYNEGYCDELISVVNDKREAFGLQPLEKNPSMCLVADVRAKESSYYNGHTRANGMPFYTVAPAYFKAECLSVTLKDATPRFIIDNWMQSKATRNNILNPDFKCIGASYFTTGKYSLATLAFGE